MDCLIRRPAEGAGPFPVIVNSVPADWGPNERAAMMTDLMRYLAGAGYMTISVRHLTSDKLLFPRWVRETEDWGAYMLECTSDMSRHRSRFLDIHHLLDVLPDWNGTGSLAGQIDLSRIGASGYSLGAATALSLVGQLSPPDFQSYRDARVNAAIAYGSTLAEPSEAMFAHMDAPCLYITGTRDYSYDASRGPGVHLKAWRLSPTPAKYALMLKGADHATFSGMRADQLVADNRERLCHQWMRSASLAFWDAHLCGDETARRWLDLDMKRQLGRDGRLWRK